MGISNKLCCDNCGKVLLEDCTEYLLLLNHLLINKLVINNDDFRGFEFLDHDCIFDKINKSKRYKRIYYTKPRGDSISIESYGSISPPIEYYYIAHDIVIEKEKE